MKNIILGFFIIVFWTNLTFGAVSDCSELKPVLEQFYSASKNENLDEYMQVMDKEYIVNNMLENYEDYVKSAWEVFDVVSYEITDYNCKIDWNSAVYYFNVKSKLKTEEWETDVQRNYVWYFHKLDDWKIRYVTDEDIIDEFKQANYWNIVMESIWELIDEPIIASEKFVEQVDSLEEIDNTLAWDIEENWNDSENNTDNSNESDIEISNENITDSSEKIIETKEETSWWLSKEEMRKKIEEYENKHKESGSLWSWMLRFLVIVGLIVWAIVYIKKFNSK